ncbi:MAG TPA: radical SAM protein, partial [Thermoanaerobaculia bacterium]|nr:radical SAM protein [Thermoanaerobaculia bacterium]
MLAALRTNPALLKLDLYCKGIRLDDSCLVSDDGGRPILRTRAGLGSGLEAILPGGLWTNVPVSEPFAQKSPYTLHRAPRGDYWVHWRGDAVAPIDLSPRPGWYDAALPSGKPMTRIGTLQGTYLGIYQAKVCEYWTQKPTKVNCKFCSVGLNLGVDDADEKSVDEVMRVVHAARAESGITYVDFNTGHYDGDTYLDILEPYIVRIKRELGLLVGVQTPPHRDLTRYDHLREIGVNRVSFCFEIFDPQIFQEICPGKHAEYGLDFYLEAIRYCAQLGRKGP